MTWVPLTRVSVLAMIRLSLEQQVALDGMGGLYVGGTQIGKTSKRDPATGAQLAVYNVGGGVAADGAGNLYVANSADHTVVRVATATGQIATVAGASMQAGSSDGVAAAARFNKPTAVALGPGGELYVVDSGNSTIRKIVLATSTVTTLAGVVGQSGVKPGALPARLNTPRGLAVLPGGDLLVSDESAVLTIRFH